VFTKCSRVPGPGGTVQSTLRRDSIRQECEQSLRRLGIERIDLYQLHWPRPPEDIEEGWQALAQLQREGKVRWIGVSNFDLPQLERIRRLAPVTSLQPPYSALAPDAERELLPYCRREGIGVLAYSPMRSGLLTGKMTRERIAALPEDDWRRRHPDFQEPRLGRHLALQDLLGRIGARHGFPAAVVALAWVLRDPAVTGAIVGARRPEQVEGFAPAMEFRLSPEEIEEIGVFLSGT
jgi:aryl-alcohol dehydrogenase-like predicted oxidoreductase